MLKKAYVNFDFISMFLAAHDIFGKSQVHVEKILFMVLMNKSIIFLKVPSPEELANVLQLFHIINA